MAQERSAAQERKPWSASKAACTQQQPAHFAPACPSHIHTHALATPAPPRSHSNSRETRPLSRVTYLAPLSQPCWACWACWVSPSAAGPDGACAPCMAAGQPSPETRTAGVGVAGAPWASDGFTGWRRAGDSAAEIVRAFFSQDAAKRGAGRRLSSCPRSTAPAPEPEHYHHESHPPCLHSW